MFCSVSFHSAFIYWFIYYFLIFFVSPFLVSSFPLHSFPFFVSSACFLLTCHPPYPSLLPFPYLSNFLSFFLCSLLLLSFLFFSYYHYSLFLLPALLLCLCSTFVYIFFISFFCPILSSFRLFADSFLTPNPFSLISFFRSLLPSPVLISVPFNSLILSSFVCFKLISFLSLFHSIAFAPSLPGLSSSSVARQP